MRWAALTMFALLLACAASGGCCARYSRCCRGCLTQTPAQGHHERHASAAPMPNSRFHPVPTRPVFLPPHALVSAERLPAVLPEIPPPKKVAPPAETHDSLPEPAPAPVIEKKPKPLIPEPPADEVPAAPTETKSKDLEVTDDPPATEPGKSESSKPAPADSDPFEESPAPKAGDSGRRPAPPVLNAPEVAEQATSRRISALITRPGITVERWKPPTR